MNMTTLDKQVHYCDCHAMITKEAGFSDITPVFNLIQVNSSKGHFNSVYLQPSYQAGLGIQLFSIRILKKIRLPDGSWHKASLLVARQNKELAGFILIRQLAEPALHYELYMTAVDERYQRQGIASCLLKTAIAKLPNAAVLTAECMPKSIYMKKLLVNRGFKAINSHKKSKSRMETLQLHKG